MKTSAFVIAVLTSNASAFSVDRPYSDEMLEYRPYTNGDTPWYKTSQKQPDAPDYPVDYKVPDFGVDTEIVATQGSQASSEKVLGRKLQATFTLPKPHPINYFVPNFGEDSEILTTNKNLAASEKLSGKKFKAATLADVPTYPINYRVPDLGRDKDIIATEKHASMSEKQHGHIWSNSKNIADAAILRNYPMPDLGVDQDIITTNANLKKAEQTLGPWNPELTLSQADIRMERPVSIAEMMRRTNQVYQPYEGLAFSQVHLRDDQICTSGLGCPVNPGQAAEEAATIKYRTDVPLDPEVGDTVSNEKYASNQLREQTAFQEARFGRFIPSNN